MKLRTGILKLTSASISSLVFIAGAAHASQTANPTERIGAPTYAEVKPIIADNCQACHTGGPDMAVAGVSLDTEAEVVSQAKRLFVTVDSGLMPYGDSEWHTSPDGVKLLAYLQSVAQP